MYCLRAIFGCNVIMGVEDCELFKKSTLFLSVHVLYLPEEPLLGWQCYVCVTMGLTLPASCECRAPKGHQGADV